MTKGPPAQRPGVGEEDPLPDPLPPKFDLRIPTSPWTLAQRLMQGGAPKQPPAAPP